jgi:transcriptional regulator with PAS, ATPase and Fis domain
MRVVAATNVDLTTCLARGALREDFYYRINIIPLQLPPLRERLEDLPVLINHILSKHPVAQEKNIKQVSPQALDQMLAYHWPGNIRELENILERAIVKCSGEVIAEVDLPAPPQRIVDRYYAVNGDADLTLKEWLHRSEKEYLRSLLIKHKGGITLTASEAQVDNKTLYRKMRRHGLHKESFKDLG